MCRRTFSIQKGKKTKENKKERMRLNRINGPRGNRYFATREVRFKDSSVMRYAKTVKAILLRAKLIGIRGNEDKGSSMGYGHLCNS